MSSTLQNPMQGAPPRPPKTTRGAQPASAADAADAAPAQSLKDMAAKLGVPFVEQLADRPASALFLQKVPIGYARRHRLLGLAGDNDALAVAVADLAGWDCLDVLGRWLDRPITPLLAPAPAIQAAINAAYQERTGQAEALIQQLDPRQVLADVAQLPGSGGREDLLDVASRAPVIQAVNLMLFEAVKQQASDVHLQPHEERLVVRLRIDGVLFDAFDLPKPLQEEIVSRIKVMGRMNIAEKRLAQDGRATVQVGDRLIDLRLSSVPTSGGERIVIRLLDKSARLYTLHELGMPAHTLTAFRSLIGLEHGLVLVTGPTGSGKSTTLYAALQELDRDQANILTLEDPIEYGLEGISQIQVATKKGMTFASGLRSVLRQDPDIIMVGEIRDAETATLAIQAALTGHLVFSTLHTNDAASAVTRLLDLGIEPYLVASSVVGVMAQRLVRRVCAQCGRTLSADEAAAQLERLGEEASAATGNAALRLGAGCEHCRHTGYRGRVGIFELLMINEQVRRQVQHGATASDVKQAALAGGLRTLREDGVAKVLTGATTVDEVLRVTMRATR